MSLGLQLKTPYLLFLGDVPSMAFAKTALGLVQWVPELCVAQLRFPDCEIDTGIADMTIDQAVQAGAKSLLIGSAPVGGAIQQNWMPVLLEAIAAGMDIISGLHSKLNDNPALRDAAHRHQVRLVDVRQPPENLPIGNGSKRSGQRLLTVGTDCSVGKKYTALAIAQALRATGVDCDFRPSGQTGIMIAGNGIPMDAVVSDFIAGAAECLSPENHAAHWDVIEGQGSLFQPAYAGVSLGLLHGSQPDAIVVCHDPSREQTIGCPGYQLPTLNACIQTHLQLGRLTNPNIRCIGVSINSSLLSNEQRQTLQQQITEQTGLPCVDPIIDGVDALIASLIAPQTEPVPAAPLNQPTSTDNSQETENTI